MAHVTVTIAGKTYRMACGEGEEDHLTALATGFDAKVAEMRKAFGEIGDMRLHVMAALTVSDELAELKSRFAALETEAAGLREAAASGEARLAEGIEKTAERIERLTQSLNTPASRGETPGSE
ncbi:cell division protein ZapA [Methylobacterium haplocladii]|uniref:Cell division protein ZapA n=1 Tax=Methylobacterium haplocladii TaxID=1176176 RepID=A0A512IQY1_9HYPH|nr:cell division protein ZapA [Methylobacterium haplocladii]GEP00134.1 cell division protein ZapA [Methylobacterium haplocladii]GJD85384.1 Cell division protein ZapA [Methylobacterium haplocladii]GLS58182.1 cell division protein ZapA [Methylobacterium haplocladii]